MKSLIDKLKRGFVIGVATAGILLNGLGRTNAVEPGVPYQEWDKVWYQGSTSFQYIPLDVINDGKNMILGYHAGNYFSHTLSGMVAFSIRDENNEEIKSIWTSGAAYNSLSPLKINSKGNLFYGQKTTTYLGSSFTNLVEVDLLTSYRKTNLVTDFFKGAPCPEEISEGYLWVGENSNNDLVFMKTDYDLNILSGWPKTISTERQEVINGIQRNSTDFFGYGGVANSPPQGYLFGFTEEGDILWEKFIEGAYSFNKAVKNPEGYVFSSGSQLYKLDNEKNVLPGWPKSYDGINGIKYFETKKDGNIILCGNQSVVETDSEGNLIWENKRDTTSRTVTCFSSQGDGGIIAFDYYKWGRDPVRYNLNAFKLSGPPPVEPPVEFPDKSFPDKANMVIVIHGWNSSGKGNWPEQMAENIYSHFHDSVNRDEWNVTFYDWRLDASLVRSPTPGDAIARAQVQGKLLGKKLANKDYKHVHLVGHSVASYLMGEVAKKIKSTNPECEIDISFLDPYVRLFEGRIIARPEFTTSAINYYVEDNTGTLTGRNMINTTNVNLENICSQVEKTHKFPHEWFEKSITNPNLDDGTLTWGFCRSLEGGGKEAYEETKRLEKGNGVGTLDKIVSGLSSVGNNLLSTSSTGFVIIFPGKLEMATSPAQTQRTLMEDSPSSTTVWIESKLQIPEDNNYIRFNYQRDRETPGIASFFLNDHLIYISDGRVEDSSSQDSGEIDISGLTKPSNTFSVRLEDAPTTPTVFSVSDIEHGKIGAKASSSNWQMFE